ncbi:phosphatase phospho-type [Dichotomocladium elegans]|nr:phosphatase phospho-type [Dichotomocladium elegans]
MTIHDLAVFDFDWSLIEADSDAAVLSGLSPLHWQKCRSAGVQWTDLMDQTLCELQDEGYSQKNIKDILEQVPLVPSAVELLKALAANHTRVLVLSDANTFYVETILKAQGVRHLVTDIITNPTYVDGKGRLRINRRILPTDTQHNCPNPCGLNICKGQELDRYIATYGPFRQIMYIGDGKNDYCPALRLKSSDHYFVRSGRKLAEWLSTDTAAAGKLVVPVTYWDTHATIVQALL